MAGRFVGDLTISGPTIITSSSLSLPNANASYNVGSISISNDSVLTGSNIRNNNLKNLLIENLTLSGSYRAIVESKGVVTVPSSVSQYDYIELSVPKTFDLTLKTLDGTGKAEFIATISNDSGDYKLPLIVENNEEIRFHNITLQNSSNLKQTLVMKGPEINATGDIMFDSLYIPHRDVRDVKLRELNASLGHSDTYLTNYKNASRVQYVTYINWIQPERIPLDKQMVLKIPGDISERAKRMGLQVQWQGIMLSENGIILLFSVLSVTIIATVVLWRSRRNFIMRP